MTADRQENLKSSTDHSPRMLRIVISGLHLLLYMIRTARFLPLKMSLRCSALVSVKDHVAKSPSTVNSLHSAMNFKIVALLKREHEVYWRSKKNTLRVNYVFLGASTREQKNLYTLISSLDASTMKYLSVSKQAGRSRSRFSTKRLSNAAELSMYLK